MKVNILLSTYNGEKFLSDQVKSIQAQTFTEWNLLIRDDGSTDKTLEIIEQFVKNDYRIKIIPSNGNLKSIGSFFALAKYEKADYYFFCDQDDVWLAKKIQTLLDLVVKLDQKTPRLVYSELSVVDQNLHVMTEKMVVSQSGHPNLQLFQEMTENTITGCTMMVNHALISLWVDTDEVIMHDWWLGLLASAVGELVFYDQPLIYYRQHANNVLGARTLKKRVKRWFNNWLERYWQLIKNSQKQANKLLNYDLSEEQRELVETFVTIFDHSHRLRLLKKYHIRKNKNLHTFIFRFLITTKFAYKKEN
ncbi:MAG TPA: glycosyltransferase family 2 protein [Lactovum miscens]|uniref:glycosyltransferase family 2 protein n=1 Tax=Lactovum miscens TaxID=190387 RepID=UPI002ED7E941